MKRILNKILHKSYKDNRGLSLVEVLCAVAILALVTGVIGSVIVISTRTYRRGISETSIQQEAQLAANNIGNIVKDACGVIYGESNEFYVKNGVYNEDGSPKLTDEDGTVRVPDSTGNPKKQSDKFTELSIITNEKIQYTMTYDEEQKKLLYQEYSTVDGSSLRGPEVMATNVSDFKADTKDFENSKTIKLTMKVEDSDTNRDIPMEYTMTSRNGDGEGGEYVTNTDSVVIIFLEDDVVLVPGETYQIPLSVSGKLNEGGLEWESVTGLTAGALTMDYAEVTVPIDSAGGPASFTVRTKDKDGEGNPKDRKSCSVAIRKVTGVAVSHSIDNKDSQGGMLETAGTVYTFNANVTGTELAKRVAYAYDSNYKTAQAVVWSWELIVDGVTCKREWTCSQNADGKYEFAFTDTNPEKFEEYISVMTNKENAIVPQLILKIEKHMPSDFSLTVRATSKHALGVNKADSAYGDKDDPMYYGEDLVTPRETILNNGLEIILEPQEEGRVSLDMKGGLTSDVTFEYHGATDLYDSVNNTQGTWTTYDSYSDEAVITLGRDEKGSGPGGADPYTFTIDVLVSGVKKSTIAVHVCRIDELSIEVVDNFQDKQGSTMALPTYDFRARLNVSNGKNDPAMQKAITYLIQYKEDGTPDSEVVKNTLSSRITWELIDYNGGSKVVSKDSVICMAGIGVGNTGEIIGSYTKKHEYYQVVNVKPARIEQKEDGTWYVKQVPEIDISPSAKTDTGLPANYELKVTIEAIHPLGMAENTKYNKTGQPYGVAESSASIKGELTIDTPTKVVVVEPGQGTNDSAQSDNEMVVPIEVHGGAVHSMEVKISGNSSKDTKLSSYTTEDANGNHNPYMSGNATSASQTRIWYMGLLIGEDEKGNSNGRIQIHIDAYNSQGKVVASTDFDLGVRRVDSVDVKVADSKKLEDVNQEGITVKLEALPKGRGNNGTEFYDIQKDENDNTCRWEQKDHGEYKEPSPMEWKMVIKGTEKPLAEWTEYFEAGSIKTSVNESDHKATVEFALKQSLPSGTKIRAYSLHARGKVGETKYNKSGKKYGDVYGEIIFDDGIIVVSGGWKRGGTLDIAYNVPEENIYTDENGRKFLVKDGEVLWNNSVIATHIAFMSRYQSSSQWTNVIMESFFTHNAFDDGKGIGGERGGALFEGKSLTEFTATIYAWGEENLKKTSYSAPYTDGLGAYIDMNRIKLKVNVGSDDVNATGTIAVDEKIYDIPDVVFQYQNSLPETSRQSGDSDGAWTNKNGDNTLKVYVTPDDTISSYKSYYKLSEGWEETYERYTLLPSRYVGVINDSKTDDSLDERLFDFTVTNTTGEGNEEGRSYVNFTFSKNVRSQYRGKVVKMIYEYNPYLCNTNDNSAAPYAWAYGNYKKEQLDEIDGCDGILEFHFVDANINTKSGVTMPEVRYCPTYSENKSSATPNYYYISETSRFYIDSNGTDAQYQTGSAGKWTTKYSMTYTNGSWTIQ